jgi:hypothetical protein
MKHLKSFNESVIGFKPSEANKIKFLTGFEFYRVWSDIYGYTVDGKRTVLPLERISIYKEDDKYVVEITRKPGYFKDLISAGLTGWEESWYGGGRVWSTKEEFTDIESVKDYLLSYEWYDLKN